MYKIKLILISVPDGVKVNTQSETVKTDFRAGHTRLDILVTALCEGLFQGFGISLSSSAQCPSKNGLSAMNEIY